MHDSEYDDQTEVISPDLVEVIPASQWQYVRVNPPIARRERRVYLPFALFAATCVSTLWIGMVNSGGQSFSAAFLGGLMYALPLMTILIFHEMGHFLQATRYGVAASYPFFIPMPFPPIGTMGAVIMMEARMGSRRALFDIGITGPLAGLIPTLIFCVIGIHFSELKAFTPHPSADGMLGSPLVFDYMCQWLGRAETPGYVLILHPIAFAGWVGLLLTSLNLIPIGQLDGGHVLYALLLEKSYAVTQLLVFSAVASVVFFKLWGWSLMLFLLIFVIGTRHPPTANDSESLGWVRIILGWLTLAFIIIGFTPDPFMLSAGP